MAHRGQYAFDSKRAATVAIVETRGDAVAKKKTKLAADLIPIWLLGAPRAAAKAYVARINALLPKPLKQSAAALLFGVTSVELRVKIPLPLAGFTIAQLQFPKGTVSVVSRHGPDGKSLDKGAQLKLSTGDELVLRGTPHSLATVASIHGGVATLLKPKESEGMRAQLRAEHDSLHHAAQELFDRMLPRVRHMQRSWSARRRREAAATRLQAAVRGKQTRFRMRGQLDTIYRNRLVARLMVRRVAAAAVRNRCSGPILHRRLLKKLAEPSHSSAQEALASLDDTDLSAESTANIHQLLGAKRARIAATYAGALNKIMAAAPEAKELGAPMPLLTLLLRGPVVVTAKLTQNELMIGKLNLPNDIQPTRMTINGKSREVKNLARLDGQTKLLKGDDMSLHALPHRLPLVLEVKGGKLAIAPVQKSAEAEQHKRSREMLLGLANKLACWLQAAVKIRVAQRVVARRAHAALMIQLSFAAFMMRRRASPMSASFVRRVTPGVGDPNATTVRLLHGTPSARKAKHGDPHARAGVGKFKWKAVRTDHSAKIKVASVFNGELKRARQKKKPSQARKAAGGGGGGGAAAGGGGKKKLLARDVQASAA